jgi:hypothetical protein
MEPTDTSDSSNDNNDANEEQNDEATTTEDSSDISNSNDNNNEQKYIQNVGSVLDWIICLDGLSIFEPKLHFFSFLDICRDAYD